MGSIGLQAFCLSLTATEAADPATGTQREDLRGGLHWFPKDTTSTGHADNTVPLRAGQEMEDRRRKNQEIKQHRAL